MQEKPGGGGELFVCKRERGWGRLRRNKKEEGKEGGRVN